MRREAAVLVVIGLGLSLSSCRCPEGQECLDPRVLEAGPCPEGQICMDPPDPTGDVVAGCEAEQAEEALRGVDAASLVKIHVTLTDKPGTGCVTEKVRPKGVCVLQGGAIRWRVKNGCSLSSEPGEPVLEIRGVEWLSRVCDARFTELDSKDPAKNDLFCNVPEDDDLLGVAHTYTVEGPNVSPEDPWIVVKKPR